MKSVLTPLAKHVLLPLGLLAGMSVADAAIEKNYTSGSAALIISNEEMEDIMKTVKFLEESGLLIKGINETIKNETKKQKEGFLSMLLGAWATGILGNAITGEDKWRHNYSSWKILIPPHSLTNFETKKYYQNGPKFNGVYTRNN